MGINEAVTAIERFCRGVDPEAYERAAAAAIREALPETSPFKLDVRAEADPATSP